VGDPFWGRGEEEEAHPRRLSAVAHVGRRELVVAGRRRGGGKSLSGW
jgi:hypothetical protein